MRYMLIEWHFAGEIWFVNDQFWGYPISGQTPLVQIRKLLCPYFVKIYRVVGSDSRASKIVPIPKTPWDSRIPGQFSSTMEVIFGSGLVWLQIDQHFLVYLDALRAFRFDVGWVSTQCATWKRCHEPRWGGGPSMFFRMPPLWPCCSASLGRDS